MNGKASTVLNPGSFVEIFLGLWLLNFETCNFLLKGSRLFFSVKAFLCFYDKKNSTWLLTAMEILNLIPRDYNSL